MHISSGYAFHSLLLESKDAKCNQPSKFCILQTVSVVLATWKCY